MKRFWADLWWVAVYELGEAVRTRLFQLVLLAYAAGIAGTVWVLVETLQEAEASIAATLGVPATERPGALLGEVLKEPEIARGLARVMGQDDAVAVELLKEPLVALWTGVTSMALLPLVMVFSASGSIAAEVKSRSVRYLLCRTGRLEIGLGKLAGQLLVAIVAALLGAAVAWLMGMTMMVGNPPVGLAVALLGRTLRSVLWALPFAGLGLAASQLVASPNGARFLAGAAFFGMPVAAGVLHFASGPAMLGRFADIAAMFLATQTWDDYWSTDPAVLGAAVLHGVLLSVVYFAGGYVVFARRDL